MTNRLLLLSVLTMLFSNLLFAGGNDQVTDAKYRRSSLHTILIESDKFPMKDTVISAYYNAPFPDKYNNHTIGEKSFNPSDYGFVQTKKSDTVSYNKIIDVYLEKNKIANKLVAKWFNRAEDGSFDMSMIGARGSYNASDMEAIIAKNTARGSASLADAGEELISNTFVVVSKLNFISNETAAAITRDVAIVAARQIPNSLAQMAAVKAAEIAYEKGKEGYTVWTSSYLYQLEWNDSISSIFYNDYWMDKTSIDAEKKSKFDNSDLFKLKFIGSEKSSSLVTYSLKEKRTEAQIVTIATVRNIDAVYVKLQKKYDVFKTKTPLFTGEPITAKIGMKEGLEGGERFEVLEMVMDKDGKTSYDKKGTITVEKDQIWDNRFNAGEEVSGEEKKSKKGEVIDRTFFKGEKNLMPGMLIRQIK